VSVATVPTRRPGRLSASAKPLLRERSFVTGAAVLGLLVLVTIFGPLIVHTSPTATNFPVLATPSSAHPFGTDHYGRDVLIRVIEAIGLDIAIAATVAALATLVGTTVGLVSGYVGGALDLTVMRVVDVMMSIPAFILALITAIVLGNTLRTLVFALAFAYTPVMIRIVRSQALYLRASCRWSRLRSPSARRGGGSSSRTSSPTPTRCSARRPRCCSPGRSSTPPRWGSSASACTRRRLSSAR
jgi:peptide/nickel transport system permease protein